MSTLSEAAPPQRGLFAYHRTKTARQELTSFSQTLELAFGNIVSVVSEAISVRRRVMLVDGCDENVRIAIYPMESAAERSAGLNMVQLAWTQWEGGKQFLVISKHDLSSDSDSVERDGRLEIDGQLFANINST